MFGVISNFNSDPRHLNVYLDELVIYDQSPRIQPWITSYPSGVVIRSHHVGHNILDYVNFIIQHQHSLPDLMLFGKGNMIPRHITEGEFASIMNAPPPFTPVWSWGQFSSRPGKKASWVDDAGMLNETNNDWFVSSKNHPRFKSTNDLANFLFENWSNPEFLGFSPGAMYVVARSVIEAQEISAFYCLSELLESNFFPAEAYMIERLMPGILTGKLRLRPEWNRLDVFIRSLDQLPDCSLDFVAPPGPTKVFRQFFGRHFS